MNSQLKLTTIKITGMSLPRAVYIIKREKSFCVQKPKIQEPFLLNQGQNQALLVNYKGFTYDKSWKFYC